MHDRELLKWASKAAGVRRDSAGFRATNGMPINWNPLLDDGDALRLVVKLGLIDEYKWKAPITGAIFDECNRDWYAATRRAIVVAAAEIGKAMPRPQFNQQAASATVFRNVLLALPY